MFYNEFNWFHLSLGGLSLSFLRHGSKSDDKSEIAESPFAMFNLEYKEIDIHLFKSEWSKKSEKEFKKFNKFLKNLLITF